MNARSARFETLACLGERLRVGDADGRSGTNPSASSVPGEMLLVARKQVQGGEYVVALAREEEMAGSSLFARQRSRQPPTRSISVPVSGAARIAGKSPAAVTNLTALAPERSNA